jgi:hypothetical protein
LDTLRIILGMVLLAFGRKLFWLVVAAIGFSAGYYFASQLVPDRIGWLAIFIALLAGIGGALLAIFAQNIGLGLAGFIGGGFLALRLAQGFGVAGGNLSWGAFILGGILGLLLVVLLFDWALIVLSSLLGAFLVATTLIEPSTTGNVLLLVLFVAGIVIQYALMRRE